MTVHDWSINRTAAKAIALNATNVGDARQLLDMVGLLTDDGRHIAPDDTRNYDDIAGGLDNSSAYAGGRLATWGEAPDRPDTYTTPAALRNLPTIELPPAAPKTKTAPKAKTTPAPKTATPARDRRPPCGSPYGAKAHRRRGETPCRPCLDAYNTHALTYPSRHHKSAHTHGQRPPCGTPKGARSHRHHGEPVCEPCREARNAYDRDAWARRKTQTTGQTVAGQTTNQATEKATP